MVKDIWLILLSIFVFMFLILIFIQAKGFQNYKDTLDNRAFEINAAQYNIRTGKVEYTDPEVKFVLAGER
jgi:hypothetical protein